MRHISGVFLTILLLLTSHQVMAADEGAADYRHHTMEAVGGHMNAIADIVRQKVPHSSHIAMHANALDDIAQISDVLFPAGSEGHDALPAIWENPEDFAEKLNAWKVSAAAFREAAATGAMENIGPALQNMGQTCKGCHDDYRAE
jgi:cytochrome c556